MPALPTVSKVLQQTLHYDLGDGTPAITRYFLQYSGSAPVASDLATFDTAAGTAWNANLAALLDSGGQLKAVSSIDLSSVSGAVDQQSTVHSGSRGSAFIGASTCLVCSYRIARRYRGGHSRGYWPMGIQTDLSDRNTWKSTFTSAAQTGITNYFAAVLAAVWGTGGTLTHVNVSYYHGFTVVTNPITGRATNRPTLRGTPLVDPVLSITAQAAIGSQRRRDAYH